MNESEEEFMVCPLAQGNANNISRVQNPSYAAIGEKMKTTISAVAIFALFGCSQPITETKTSQPITETETLLLCEGDVQSIIAGLGEKDRQAFTITKLGEKITKVKAEYQTFTLAKVDVSTKENKGPIYVQLIVESDKLILRSEITEDKNNRDTILFNTGKYEQDRGLFGWAKGQCSVGKKAF